MKKRHLDISFQNQELIEIEEKEEDDFKDEPKLVMILKNCCCCSKDRKIHWNPLGKDQIC
jgi:hypothetical protein